MTLPSADDRRAFMRVLTWLARTHWDSDVIAAARTLLRRNQQALPAVEPESR